ncbi:sensor histidine kinase [Clostridium botulinum]|uniref:sensor histidine kinase n=1 Tax=Clostridium botulinum TaxID=1491 RepID=UPI003DA3F0B6
MKVFIRDHLALIVIYILSFTLTIIYCMLTKALKATDAIYIVFFNLLLLICFLVYRYNANKGIYDILSEDIAFLEESTKDLGASALGEAMGALLEKQYNLYQGKIQKYNQNHKEHLTFMNHWVHQMKTPLSVIQLYIQENEGEEMAENLKVEVDKLNKGLNMAIYFARLDEFEKDFHAEKVDLYSLIIEMLNEEKRLFIKNRVLLELKLEEDIIIYSDKKWIKFAIEQIITNGVKYSKGENKRLTIELKKISNMVVLDVVDRGVGIPKKDIKRVFDAFYTGENGRVFGESTGMGLYIVKKVCDSLEHKIEIESKAGEGTRVRVIFRGEL